MASEVCAEHIRYPWFGRNRSTSRLSPCRHRSRWSCGGSHSRLRSSHALPVRRRSFASRCRVRRARVSARSPIQARSPSLALPSIRVMRDASSVFTRIRRARRGASTAELRGRRPKERCRLTTGSPATSRSPSTGTGTPSSATSRSTTMVARRSRPRVACSRRRRRTSTSRAFRAAMASRRSRSSQRVIDSTCHGAIIGMTTSTSSSRPARIAGAPGRRRCA